MTEKTYTFKVWDENLQKFLDSKEKFSEWIRKILIDLMNGKPLDSDDVDLEYKKLRNQNLEKKNKELDIHNRLKLIHDLHLPPSVALQVEKGEITIDEALRPTIKKDEETFRGLDANGYCGTCFHEHFLSNGVCTRTGCNCGIRG